MWNSRTWLVDELSINRIEVNNTVCYWKSIFCTAPTDVISHFCQVSKSKPSDQNFTAWNRMNVGFELNTLNQIDQHQHAKDVDKLWTRTSINHSGSITEFRISMKKSLPEIFSPRQSKIKIIVLFQTETRIGNISVLNTLDRIVALAIAARIKLINILLVYREEWSLRMDMHWAINGIISIVLRNIWMNYVFKELLKRLFIFFHILPLIVDSFI